LHPFLSSSSLLCRHHNLFLQYMIVIVFWTLYFCLWSQKLICIQY
jgi:hypothetical protein